LEDGLIKVAYCERMIFEALGCTTTNY